MRAERKRDQMMRFRTKKILASVMAAAMLTGSLQVPAAAEPSDPAQTFTVTYTTGNGMAFKEGSEAPEQQTFQAGGSVTIEPNTLVRTDGSKVILRYNGGKDADGNTEDATVYGYTPDGWKTMDAAGTPYADGSTYQEDKDLELEPVFRDTGKTVLPELTKDGYGFDGWYYNGTKLNVSDYTIPDNKNNMSVSLDAGYTLDKPDASITAEPADTTLIYGESPVTLTVDIANRSDSVTYTYDWYKDGKLQLGDDMEGSSITVKNVSESGEYYAIVHATDGTLKSEKQTNRISVSISKAPAVITLEKSETELQYGTDPEVISVDATEGVKDLAASSSSPSYVSAELAGDKLTLTALRYTDQPIVVTVSGKCKDQNNYDIPISKTVTVRMKKGKIAYTAYPVSALYNGAEQQLGGVSVSDPADGYKIYYSKEAFKEEQTGNISYGSAVPAVRDAGTYYIYYQVQADNYELAEGYYTVTVGSKAVTVSGITAEDKTYDGTDKAELDLTGVQLDGVQGTDSLTVTAEGTFEDASAGTDKKVSIHGITVSGGGQNYVVSDDSQTKATASINKKKVSVSGLSVNDKTYDGTADAEPVTDQAALSGILDADAADVSLDQASVKAAFEDKNAGEDKNVTLTGIALTGDKAGNYEVEDTAETSASIKKKDVSVTDASAEDRPYDGTTDVSVKGGTLEGAVAGDDVTLVSDAVKGTIGTPDVGTGKKVAVTGFTLAGADKDNYALSQPDDVTVDITKKEIAVEPKKDQSKVYHTDDQTFAYTLAEEIEVEGSLAREAGEDVGDYAYTMGTLKPVSGNYQLVLKDGTFRITPAALVIVSAKQTKQLTYIRNTAQTPKIETVVKTVDGSDVSFTYSKEENGTYAKDIPSFTEAGEHTLYFKAEAANHEPVIGSLIVTIAKKTTSITLDPGSIEAVYPNGTEASFTLSEGAVYPSVKVSEDDKITASVRDGKVAVEPVKGNTEVSGTYTVTVSARAENENYGKPADVTLAVTVKKGKITSTAAVPSLTYNGKDQTTVSVSVSDPADARVRYSSTTAQKAENVEYTLDTAPTVKEAGDYTIYYQITRPSYETVTGAADLRVAPCQPVIGAEDASVIFNDGKESEQKIAYTYTAPEGVEGTPDGMVTVSSDNKRVAEVSVDESTKEITVTPKKSGAFNLTIASAATKNYKAAEKTIKVTVENGTMTVEEKPAQGLVYNGKDQVIASVVPNVADTTVTYRVDGGEEGKAPYGKDAGEYTVSYTVKKDSFNDATGTFKASIAKADMADVSVNQAGSLTYIRDTAQTAAVTTNATTVDGSAAAFTYSTEEDGTYSETVPAFTEAGKHTVCFKADEKNHNEAKGSFIVTIAKKATSIAVDPVKVSAKYPGDTTAKVIRSEGAVSPSVKVSDEDAISASVEGDTITISPVKGDKEVSGDYTVTVSAEAENGNYEKPEDVVLNVTIEKGQITSVENIPTLTYNGKEQSLGSVSVSDPKDAEVLYSAETRQHDLLHEYSLPAAPSVTEAGDYTVYYQITRPSYESVTGSYDVTVVKCRPAIRAEDTTVTFNDGKAALETVSYTYTAPEGVAGTPDGNVTVTSDDTSVAEVSVDETAKTITVIPKKSGSFDLTIKADASDNYEAAEKTVKVTVQNGTMNVTEQPAQGLVYNGKEQNLGTVTSDIPDTDITYTVNEGKEGKKAEGKDAGNYTVSYTVHKDSFDDVTGTFTVNIEKAVLTDVSAEQDGSLTYVRDTAQTAEVRTNAKTVDKTDAVFTYSSEKDGAYTEAVPAFTEAGEHTVFYKVNAANHKEAAGSFIVTIAKKATAITLDKAEVSARYPSSASVNATFSEGAVNGTVRTDSENVKTSLKDGTVTVRPVETDKDITDDYTVTVSADAENSNYEKPSDVSFVVHVENGSITSAADVPTLTFNGKVQQLGSVTVSDPKDAKILYSRTTDKNAKDITYDLASAPVRVHGGTYTVHYQITRPDYETVTGSYDVVIAACQPEIKVEDAVLSYNGGKDAEEKIAFRYVQPEGVEGDPDGTLSVTVSDPSTASARIEGGKVIVTPKKTGITELTISASGTKDVLPAEKTVKITVEDGAFTTSASAAGNLVYNGQVQSLGSVRPSVSGVKVSYSVNGGAYAEKAEAKEAGTYQVSYKAEGYGYKTVTGSFTVIIGRKTVTVRANDAFKERTDRDPALSASVAGTAAGESVTYRIARDTGEVPGTYAIRVTGPAKQGSYDVTYVNGTFTLNEKVLEVYRLYNPNSGEHFYTLSTVERDYLDRIGWNYEGIGWYSPIVSSHPVYRLYNPNVGDHLYTLNAGERDYLVNVGWNYEGIGWYASDRTDHPVYRQYNPNAVTGTHNYTTSKLENDYLDAIGWNAEGIAWYSER